MDIIETEDMWVLRAERRLTIPQIKAAAAELGPQIDASAQHANLTVRAPWIFIAHNLPKDGKTSFEWQICRPLVEAGDYAGPFELVRLEPIMVARAVHRGPIRTLFTQGYAPLVSAITESRHAFSGESREIYRHYAGPGAAYQEIEIQFGLAY